MDADKQSFFNHLTAQLAYYKKRTAVLVVLLLVWGILLGKYWLGRGDRTVQASTPVVVPPLPTGVPTNPQTQAPEVLAYWEDLHREMQRNPFDSPSRPSPGTPEWPTTPVTPTPGDQPDGSTPPPNNLTDGLVLMGTINPAGGSGQAGAIINDALYRVGDVIRGSQLRLLKIIDEDSVLLGDVSSGTTMVLTTQHGDLR